MEELPEVHGNTDDDGPLSVADGHAVDDCRNIDGSEQDAHGGTVLMGEVHEGLCGDDALHQVIVSVFIHLAAQLVGLDGGHLLELGALHPLIILRERIRRLLGGGGNVGGGIGDLNAVHQGQVSCQHLPEEDEGTGAVCQHMEHFQIDAPSVVGDPVQKAAKTRIIQGSQRREVILGHGGGLIQPVQIVPEQALAQRTVEMREFVNGLIQGLLEERGIHILRQLADNAEDAGIKPVRGTGYDDGGIVELVPSPGAGAGGICIFHKASLS